MNKKLLFTAIALCAGAFAHAGVVRNDDAASFAAATVELFAGDATQDSTYDFHNGMTYANLAGHSDLINTNDYYVLDANAPAVMYGLDWDGYFGTGNIQTTFQFKFAGGVSSFGFYGTEAVSGGSGDARDGIMHLEFYGMDDLLIDTMAVNTSVADFFWEDFYGFKSDSGAIGRVVFRDAGSMVLDNVTFEPAATAAVPEPGSIALLGLGLAGFAAARRKAARK